MNAIAEFQVEPCSPHVGARVHGVDLSRPVSLVLQRALVAAWHEHLVLLFPDQSLDPDRYLRAARIFGQPQVGAARRYYEQAGVQSVANSLRLPEISILSNLGADGQPALHNDGLGSDEVIWHSDNSYIERPPAGSMLYARELPDDGSGRTSFNNQYVALETLPDDLRAAIEHRRSKQDASRNSAGVLRPGVSKPTCPEDVPGPFHPLIRLHPDTGRKALYLGRRRIWPSQYVEGIPNEHSEVLLDRLWAHATAADLAWTHDWHVGDLLVWDNRCAMHYREPVNPSQRRVMWRSQFQGEDVLPG